MNKTFILPILALFLVLSVSYVSACSYNDHSDCLVTQTIVEGRVYYEDTNQSAGNASVAIECSHNGTVYTKNAHSINSGLLKGTYFVIFPQDQCIAGDEVTVSAVKNGLNGEEEGTIKDWISRRCLDVDVGIVNIPLVPEFGLIVGTLTIASAIVVFFVVRRK
jgi:hypothetical protein